MLSIKPKGSEGNSQEFIMQESPKKKIRMWYFTLVEYDEYGHPSIIKSFGKEEGAGWKKKKKAETFVKAEKAEQEVLL